MAKSVVLRVAFGPLFEERFFSAFKQPLSPVANYPVQIAAPLMTLGKRSATMVLERRQRPEMKPVIATVATESADGGRFEP